MLARRAVSVVVVVGPADAELVLPGLLGLGGAVAALPVFALCAKEQVAGAIDADVMNGRVDQAIGVLKCVFHPREAARAPAERLLVLEHERRLVGGDGWRLKAAVAVALDGREADAARLLQPRPPHR